MSKEKSVIFLCVDSKKHKRYVVDIATKKVYSHSLVFNLKAGLLGLVVTGFMKITPIFYPLEEYREKYRPLSEVKNPKYIKGVLRKTNERIVAIISTAIALLIASIAMGNIFLNNSRFVHYIWLLVLTISLGMVIRYCVDVVHLSKIKKYFKERGFPDKEDEDSSELTEGVSSSIDWRSLKGK